MYTNDAFELPESQVIGNKQRELTIAATEMVQKLFAEGKPFPRKVMILGQEHAVHVPQGGLPFVLKAPIPIDRWS